MERPDRPGAPLHLVLGVAFLTWLCALTTLTAITLGLSEAAVLGWDRLGRTPPTPTRQLIALGTSLRGWGGGAAVAFLALSGLPFALRPKHPSSALGYLLASVAACAAIPLVWWLLEVPQKATGG